MAPCGLPVGEEATPPGGAADGGDAERDMGTVVKTLPFLKPFKVLLLSFVLDAKNKVPNCQTN